MQHLPQSPSPEQQPEWQRSLQSFINTTARCAGSLVARLVNRYQEQLDLDDPHSLAGRLNNLTIKISDAFSELETDNSGLKRVKNLVGDFCTELTRGYRREMQEGRLELIKEVRENGRIEFIVHAGSIQNKAKGDIVFDTFTQRMNELLENARTSINDSSDLHEAGLDDGRTEDLLDRLNELYDSVRQTTSSAIMVENAASALQKEQKSTCNRFEKKLLSRAC